MKKILIILALLNIIFYTTSPSSGNEIEVYADSIDYDTDGNIIAKGNVKIIDGNKILTSNIVIINQV